MHVTESSERTEYPHILEEQGNTKQTEELLERAKGFIEMHYSDIPILSDKRVHERAAYILSVAEIEKKISPDKALKTLTDYMTTQSESLSLKSLLEKGSVIAIMLYAFRRAIFG